MAQFEYAIHFVLPHEIPVDGGDTFCVDSGGPTNYGITLAALIKAGDWDGDGLPNGDLDQDGDVDIEDIRLMDIETAKSFFRSQWWHRYGYARIHNQDIANKIFDASVNMGPFRAHKIAQQTLRAMGRDVLIDGIFGRNTVAHLNGVKPFEFLPAYRSAIQRFYEALAMNNPSKYGQYLHGWLNRAQA